MLNKYYIIQKWYVYIKKIAYRTNGKLLILFTDDHKGELYQLFHPHEY